MSVCIQKTKPDQIFLDNWTNELSEEQYDNVLKRLYKILFPGGETDFSKVLWRMSKGCRNEAFRILKQVAAHHHIRLTDDLFDNLTAMAADGLEVEWLEWDIDNPNGQYKLNAYQEVIDAFFEGRASEVELTAALKRM